MPPKTITLVLTPKIRLVLVRKLIEKATEANDKTFLDTLKGIEKALEAAVAKEDKNG